MANLGQAFVLTLIGMSVVFASLAGLMLVIKGLERAVNPAAGRRAEAPPPATAGGEDEATDLIVAAAVAYFLETERAAVFVPPVTRAGGSEWGRRARGARGPRAAGWPASPAPIRRMR